jgi:uncharacterized Zn-finger protein
MVAASKKGEMTPNAQNCYEVTRADIPLSCPMPGMSLWNSHPKVYLPIEKTGKAKCPYCGANFLLKEQAGNSGLDEPI